MIPAHQYPLGKFAVDDSGNVYIGRANWIIMKYDPSGSLVWQTQPDSGYLSTIAVNSKGEVAASGHDDDQDYFITKKFSSDANLLWKRIFYQGVWEADESDVVIGKSETIYIMCEDGHSDVSYTRTLAYDANGNLKWQQQIGGGAFNQPQVILLDHAENIIVVGYAHNFDYWSDIFIYKYDINGTKLWANDPYGLDNSIINATGCGIDQNNNVYVCFPGDSIDAKTDEDISAIGLVKYSSTGQVKWEREQIEPKIQFTWPDAETVDDSGNVYIASELYLDKKYPDDSVLQAISKFNINGKLIWEKRFALDTVEYDPSNILLDHSGSILISGSKDYSFDSYLYEMKYCNCSYFSTVSLNLPQTLFCANSAPYVLTGGEPPGGSYSGDGVGEGIFYPSIVGEGSHRITYLYGDGTGCQDSSSQDVTVAVCTSIDQMEHFSFSVTPNPFSQASTVRFSLTENSNIAISLLDLSGRVIRTIVSGNFISGNHKIEINRNGLSAGTYLLQMKTDEGPALQEIIIE